MPRPALALASFALVCCVRLAAHDLVIQTTLAPPAVVARALYGKAEPVAFAKVTVSAPGSDAVYQSGNADAQGYFCFRPSSPGEWRISVDDEMGHVQRSAVLIPEPFALSPAQPSKEPFSRLHRTVLGIALLIGLSGFWYGFRARRS